MLSMKEAIENYVEGCVGKVDCPAYKLFMKAILAGMMIAFGAAGSSVAAHDIANVGIARLVAGVVFPMGLMMVVMTGAELFTGDCLAIMATVQKKHTALKLIRMLIVVYLGNLLGSLMLTCIDYVSGQYNYSSGILGAYTIKVALGKCNLDFTTALASGILCNILVCAAVMLAARAKDVTGKLLCCFFIILLFVVSGYEHCVANMYYVPAGMIAKLNPLYVKDAMEQYGYTAQQLSTLNIPNFRFEKIFETGKAFLYRILDLIRATWNQEEDGKINIARFAYQLARIEPEKNAAEEVKQIYQEFSKSMYQWIKNKEEAKQLEMAIYLYAYLTRDRKDD